MTTPARTALDHAYLAALRDYLTRNNEESLQRAYELGRSAIDAGMRVIDIAAMHGAAMITIAGEVTDHNDLARLARQCATFLAEALACADMFVGGFQDVVKELDASHQRLRLSERLVSIGTMSAGLGHDMGNLLLPVRAHIETMERADLPPKARENLLAIRTCMEHLQHMADGLRLLALDPESQPTSGHSTSLHHWWPQVARMFRNALPRHVTLAHEIPEALPRVQIASHLLTQAMFNLVQNAGDVMLNAARGEVRITASAQPGDREVQLKVSDNGPGMTDEVRRRCLEPFFTTKTRAISTGLGLALVHSIVRKAGGRIAIDSELGRGTTFTLHLPVGSDEPAGGRSQRWQAVVTLRDPRMAAYVKSAAEALGAKVSGLEELEDSHSCLWVTDAAGFVLDQVQQFIQCNDLRRVILLGPGHVSLQAARLTVIPDLTNLVAIREALKEASIACAVKP